MFCCFSFCRPTTVKNLIELEDIAEEKAMKYGDSFLECIKEFCSEKDWPTDNLSMSLSVSRESGQVLFMCIYCMLWFTAGDLATSIVCEHFYILSKCGVV